MSDSVDSRVIVGVEAWDNTEWYERGLGLGVYGGGTSVSLAGSG